MTKSTNHKSLIVAFLLGLLLPGLGLLYAAPWVVAILGTLGIVVAYKLIAWIPLLGSAVMGVLALSCGGLNVLYARAYNRTGKRLTLKSAE